ncbi:hypothetical protein [Methylocystis sp. SB2]|uniref:hypothetical protein n=1 Tax=Methylocystis sp. (strain SB2) TaxID=743836 RepID=UPI000422EA4D|nr:hypothetical protein [Methylocystis sp. SB2]ULO24116.1 hypothetical protein LNB28_01490 [Methylocystis sp. SB2]
MSEDDKKSPAGLGSNGAIVVALFATGAYFYAQQAPFTVLRPPPMESRIEEKFHSEDVEARLWQDPFDAVARQIKKVDPDERKECEDAWTKKASTIPLHCRSPLADDRGNFRSELESARIIAVTAPGASYFEDSETRRRLRYAVLSGFHLEGYEPRNEQHIGYFRPRDHEMKGFPVAVPYEWFDQDKQKSKRILLLWIDEDVLSDTHDPLKRISAFKTMLCASASAAQCAAISYQVLGPYSSDVLRQLALAKARKPEVVKAAPPNRSRTRIASLSPVTNRSESGGMPEDAQFYVFGATVSDEQLGIRSYYERLFRVNGQDDALARAITAELNQRGVNPGSAGFQNGRKGQQIVLISDRDSLYGRSMINALARELQCPGIFGRDTQKCLEEIARNGAPDWIYTKTYHRGLDGMLPTTSTGGNSKGEDAEKRSGNESSKAKEDTKALERPFGQDQFDYLRRLAASLKEKDEELRAQEKEGIVAIGVLGNDVFDKLLVLRALKPLFPEAVFFTTDYDAALAGQEELQWTRNLIIASSYGPTLSEELQQDIPPFRSTYQTAAFLAARVAAQEEDAKENSELRKKIRDGISHPRMFEIDRRGGVVPLPTKVEVSGEAQRASDAIHPTIPSLYTKLSTKSTVGIVGILALLTVVISAFYWNKMVFPFLRATCIGLAAILVLGAGVIARWDYFAEAATEHGLGEPLAWTQGISVWPSIALRVIAAILAFCLIFDAWRELQANLTQVNARFFGPADEAHKKSASSRRGPFSVTWDKLSYHLPEIEDGNGRVHISQIWNAYLAKSGVWPIVYRIAVYVILMLMLFTFLSFIFGTPNVPWRGELRKVYYDVTTPVVFLMLILIFLVVDSTLLCLQFVNALRKHKTLWPPETHQTFEKKLELKDPLLDEWIDLNFIASRTNCISKLIYFPFAIFALMIMSRSTAFAEFALSVPILATQIVGFIIIFGCAMALCFSAEKARETAKSRLTKRLVAVKAADDSEKKVSQLETLLKLVDGLRQGSFVPLSQQPPIRALLLPIGGLGWTALLDYRLLPGL